MDFTIFVQKCSNGHVVNLFINTHRRPGGSASESHYLNVAFGLHQWFLDPTPFPPNKNKNNSLLDKLYHYGVRGLYLNWIQSYLSERQQFESFMSSNSNLKSITWGVPQGSVLGHILFIICINDILYISKI